MGLLVSKHPKSPPPSPPSTPSAALLLPPDFDLKVILHSFLKGTACGPSGLHIQHLIEVADLPIQFPICAVLRDIVSLLLSGKVPVSVAKFMTGGSLAALKRTSQIFPFMFAHLRLVKLSDGWLASVFVLLLRTKPLNSFPLSSLGLHALQEQKELFMA